jgi:putative glutamine amidotransferase
MMRLSNVVPLAGIIFLLVVAGCTQGVGAPAARSTGEKPMRPVIGITCDFGPSASDPNRLRHGLNASYVDAIYAAGGLPCPLPVPPEISPAVLDQILVRCDGLLFTGGDDIDPQRYGDVVHPETHVMSTRREEFEFELFKRADEKHIPIFAICLGFQVAHVARGGKLIQHLPDFTRSTPVEHRTKRLDAHMVTIAPSSRLARIVGCTELETNSRHHQAVNPKCPGRGLRPVAQAADGIPEASEDMEGRFLLAVQWHPEDLISQTQHLKLFEALVEAARAR